MNCSDLVKWLKENPGSGIPEGLRAHVSGCPECRRLVEEHEDLERVLWSLPAVEPPPFFETRLKAAVLGETGRTAPSWRPLLAPAAALLVLAASVAFLVARVAGPAGPVSLKTPGIAAPGPLQPEPASAPEALASGGTAIYPVWPGDGDVVSGDDVSIMASLYPAPPPGTVISMTLNDRDVSARVRAEGELLNFDPGRIEPGRHVVTITLKEAGGGGRSLTFSFFALEARS